MPMPMVRGSGLGVTFFTSNSTPFTTVVPTFNSCFAESSFSKVMKQKFFLSFFCLVKGLLHLSYLTKLFKVGFDLLVRELGFQLPHVHFALLRLRLLHRHLFAFYCMLLCRNCIFQPLNSLEHHKRKPPGSASGGISLEVNVVQFPERLEVSRDVVLFSVLWQSP